MEKGEHLRRQNLPSMLQLKYLQELKNVKKKIDRFPILPFSLSVLVSVSEWEDSPKEVTLPLGELRLARRVHIVEKNERNKIKILLTSGHLSTII